MKTRTGFVSNSSSASFVIDLNDITANQCVLIQKYFNDNESNTDGWNYYFTENGKMMGSTCMDNCSFSEWLDKQGLEGKVSFESY